MDPGMTVRAQRAVGSPMALQARGPLALTRTLEWGITLGVRDRYMRSLIVDALEVLRRPVAAFADGMSLLESLADILLTNSRGGRPELIIADAALPGCSGISLLEGLCDLQWDVPVILITDPHQEEERSRAWRIGVAGVFITPLDYDSLRSLSRLLLYPGNGAYSQEGRAKRRALREALYHQLYR